MKILPVIDANQIEVPMNVVKTIHDFVLPNPKNVEYIHSPNQTMARASHAETVEDAVTMLWPEISDLGNHIVEMLELDAGFVVVRGLKFNSYPDEVRDALLLSLLSFVGSPTAHNAEKKVLWPVTPRKSDAGRKTTFSEELGEAPMHTDSAFAANPERFICLFVVRHALCGGGKSMFLNGRQVIEQLTDTQDGRECVDILTRETFPFLVPAAFNSQRTVIEAPVIGTNPMLRFRHDCLIEGFAERPDLFTPEKLWAVNTFNDFLHTREPLTFTLQRDEMIISDNHRLLHSRSDFSDPYRYLLRARMVERQRQALTTRAA